LMGAMTSHAINAVLYQGRVSYDVEKSFAPVAIVGTVPLVFVVNPSVPADSLQSLIALARSKPGYLTMASAGNGSPQHLAGEMFKRVAGVDLLHVPYKGSGPAMTDLMGGQVLSMIETVPAAQGHVKGGKLRALAVASAQRAEALPEVPTTAEAGLPNFQVSSMFGIVAPAGTPAPVLDKLNGALKQITAKPEVKAALLNQGAVATWTTPADAAARIAAERAKWAKVISDAGVKAEEAGEPQRQQRAPDTLRRSGARVALQAPPRAWRTSSAPFSPMSRVAALVLADTIAGITDASMTRRRSTPRTRSSGSTTEAASLPMRQLPDTWNTVPPRCRANSASSPSLRTSSPGMYSAPPINARNAGC